MVRHGGWGSLSSKLPVVSGPAEEGLGVSWWTQGHIKGWWAGVPKKWALPLGPYCLSLPSTPERELELHLHLDLHLQHKVPGVFFWGVFSSPGCEGEDRPTYTEGPQLENKLGAGSVSGPRGLSAFIDPVPPKGHMDQKMLPHTLSGL